MKKMTVLLLGTLLLLPLTGCNPTKGDEVDREKKSIIRYEIYSENKLPAQVSRWLENNREFEQALLVEDEGAYYAVINRGQKNTGGYKVEINEMTLYLTGGKSRLQVKVQYIDPPKGQMVTQALTYPYVVARVHLKEKPDMVDFQIEKAN